MSGKARTFIASAGVPCRDPSTSSLGAPNASAGPKARRIGKVNGGRLSGAYPSTMPIHLAIRTIIGASMSAVPTRRQRFCALAPHATRRARTPSKTLWNEDPLEHGKRHGERNAAGTPDASGTCDGTMNRWKGTSGKRAPVPGPGLRLWRLHSVGVVSWLVRGWFRGWCGPRARPRLGGRGRLGCLGGLISGRAGSFRRVGRGGDRHDHTQHQDQAQGTAQQLAHHDRTSAFGDAGPQN